VPALILLDLWIPEYGGLRLAQEIRARHGSVAPLLVLTGEYLQGERRTALDAAGYLRKPLHVDEILAAVERLAPIDYARLQGTASA
jgi:DNA-binding response OmpR family regulator